MGLIDKMMNMMHLNEDEDEDEMTFAGDDYGDDTPSKPSRNKEVARVKTEPAKEKAPVKTTPNITPFAKTSKKQVGGMEVCVIKPSSVEDAREITETLLNGRCVLLNMEGLNIDIAQRIIDFTSGSTFAISGNLQKISNYIFVVTPSNIDISGDFQEMIDAFDLGNTNM